MEKWSVVYPWCAYLRGRVTVEMRAHTESMRSSYSWLVVPLPADGKGDNWKLIQQCREAIELLGTIALFDNDAFQALLVQKCMLQLGKGQDAALLLPRFSFVFYQYMNLDISWGSTLFNQFFLALDCESMSDEFRDAMAKVQQLRKAAAAATGSGSQKGKDSAVPKIPVEITFKPPELPAHWSVQYLRSVLETVHAIRDESDCSTSGGDHEFPFLLESVRLNINHVTLSTRSVEVLSDLLALGVKIPLLSLHNSTAIAKAPRDCMGEFISKLTRSSLTHTPESDRSGHFPVGALPISGGGGGDTLRLRGPGVDSQQFGAFCSALASSRGIESVHLSEIFTEERGYHRFAKWQWTAYAFFWRESTSDVSALRIEDTSLREEDVNAIATILAAKYPAKHLLSMETSGSDGADASNAEAETVSVLLSKGTTIEIDPYDPYDRKSFTLDADDHFLVMKDDEASEFVEVLVPGYGHCAAERDGVQYYLRSTETDAASKIPPDHCITSLHAEFKHLVQASTLQAFVQLVGPPLTSLTLKARTLSCESLDVLLRCCPRLKRLSLDILEEHTLEILVQAYKERACSISSLSLQGLELESEEITIFAHALGQKESVIAKTLEELSIGERVESYALDESNLFALLAMLETNTKIEYLKLYIENALYDNFLPLFTEFHGQALPVVKEPIPLACRVAFLSVIQQFNSEDEEHAAPDLGEQHISKKSRRQSTSSTVNTSGLDRHVVSLIFQFAAVPKQRIVHLIKFH